MKRTPIASIANILLVGVASACAGCGEASSSAARVPVSIESQDNIVSETGVLELTGGLLWIQSVSLIGSDSSVPLIGPISVDLTIPQQELPLGSSVPPGSYRGLEIELAPADDGAEMLDVQVRSAVTADSVRATSTLTMRGTIDFPEGPRSIAEGSAVELRIVLRGMFFYLAPLSDAVDGHYQAGEKDRDFLTMNLVNMFDLRVLP